MELSCLRSTVGISPECDTERSAAIRYLNDLEHISIELADSAIGSEHASGIELLQRKINMAADLMANDIRAWLHPRSNMHSAVSNGRAGIIRGERQLAPYSATQQAGIKIYSNYSQYFELYIHTLTVWIDATETVTVNLYDMGTGQTLDTFTVDAVADVPTTINVNQGYFSNRNELQLALVAATTGTPYKMDVYGGRFVSCRACEFPYQSEFIHFNGAEVTIGDTPIRSNVTSRSDSGGLAIDFSLQCSIDKFVCNMRNLLATALMYKAGELVMREFRNSTRLNAFMRLYDQEQEGLLEYYGNQYKHHLTTVLDTTYLPADHCFACSPVTKYVTTIP